jgi:hypothetical protein
MYRPPKNSSDNGVDDYGNVVVTVKELASVLGLSEPQVYTLRRRNVIQPIRAIRAHKTEFQLGPAVRAYVQYKCGQDSEAEADYHRERALKEKANRELRQILVKQTRSQISRATKKRWQTIPPEQKLAHLEKMRSARRRKSVSGAGS